MAISLVKNQSVGINLSKDNTSSKYLVSIGWDMPSGQKADLDLSAFLLSNGVAKEQHRLVFYNKDFHKSSCDSVVYSGDNRTGEGEGDDETMEVTLNKVPSDVDTITFVTTIYNDGSNNNVSNFGMVSRAFAKLTNVDTGTEELFFDLTEDFSTEDGIIAVSLVRNGSDWEFKAEGIGFTGGLQSALEKYGLA